jgi:hypothetical protein
LQALAPAASCAAAVVQYRPTLFGRHILPLPLAPALDFPLGNVSATRDKLAHQEIHNQEHAIETHKEVGREVRESIQRIGGTLPENLPPAEHIKQVEKQIKHAPPKLALDGPEAKGLIGEEPETP